MTLSYALTFDDYREANLGHPSASNASSSSKGLIGWVIFIGLAVMLYMLLNTSPKRSGVVGPPLEPPKPAAPHLHRLLAAASPGLLVGGVMWWFSRKAAQKKMPKPWDPPVDAAVAAKQQRSWRGVAAWTLFIVVATGLFMLLNQSRRNQPGGASNGTGTGIEVEPAGSLEMFDFILGGVPLVTLLLIFGLLAKRNAARQLETTWEDQSFLQRPETVEVDDDGITFTESLSRRSYDWSYFAGFRETTNLLLIYLSPYAFHIVPKRGFAGEPDLVVFRGYLLSKVQRGYFLPQTSAFPVIPMAEKQPEPN